MTNGYILKSTKITSSDLEKINKFTRRPFSEDEVYTFGVILCDNDIDRDFEAFSLDSLEQLKALFIGKTGIFNHDPKGENQTARIFDTAICVDDTKLTQLGAPYTYLLGKAYMVIGEKTQDLILEIDAGIKKEVSVSCQAQKKICSICGKDVMHSACSHKRGTMYKDKTCHQILSDITDAYEWSFVAIPAQKNAGIIKNFQSTQAEKEGGFMSVNTIDELCKTFSSATSSVTLSKDDVFKMKLHLCDLEKKATMGEMYLKSIKDSVLRLGFLSDNQIDTEIFSSVVDKMSLDELLAFEKSYKLKLEGKSDACVQLKSKTITPKQKQNDEFKI